MNPIAHQLLKATTALATLLVLTACAPAWISTAPSGEAEARQALQRLQRINPDLESFKGSGRLRVWHQDTRQSFRVAWMVSGPHHLLLVVRGITGLPVVTLASDGTLIYLRQHEHSDQLHIFKRGEADLQGILGVAVSVADVVAFLAGRIPEYAFHQARLEPGETGLKLVLQRRWNRALAAIEVDAGQFRPRQVDVFDGAGALAYRLMLSDYRVHEAFVIPHRLVCLNANEEGFQLDVQYVEVEEEIDLTIFDLSGFP